MNRTLIKAKDGSGYYHWCQGCGHAHFIPVPKWSFDGNMDSPTFGPSIHYWYESEKDGKKIKITTCHYFIVKGKINFQPDCNHKLKGAQEVALLDIPETYGLD